MLCGATVHLKTHPEHADHYCNIEVWLAHLNADNNHAGTKHQCVCGVRWTNDPILASEGKKWSREVDITPGRDATSLPEIDNKEDNETETNNPN